MRFNIFNKRSKGNKKEETKPKHNEKYKAGSTNDPILEAMQEKQPFEQAADTFNSNKSKVQNSFFTNNDGKAQLAKDIFGNIILTPDKSNPTRSSDERPMDTIRGFEYSITGDPKWIPKKGNSGKENKHLMTTIKNLNEYGFLPTTNNKGSS
ncbi:hypothetical protein MOUN0_H00474 [Monosporozyma unispora]|nr:hypothetical protein C6P44_004413 [Kazachstania unispora]